MSKIEIKNNRTNNDIHTGDMYENKKTGHITRVLSAAHNIDYILNEVKLVESRRDFLSHNKFKRRG